MIHTKILTLTTAVSLLTTLTLADISPKNGKWKPKIIDYNTKGCPSMIQSTLKQAKLYSKTKNATFSNPFHPNDLFDPKDLDPNGATDVKWVKIADDTWETVLKMGQQGMSMDMTWKIKVTSEESMDMTSKLTMNFPKEMAMMMGGSSECKIDSSGTIEHIGN